MIDKVIHTQSMGYKVLDLSNATLYSYYKTKLERYAELLPSFVRKIVDMCRYDIGFTDVVNVIFNVVNNVNGCGFEFDHQVVILFNNNTLDVDAIKIGILDGVLYIPTGNKMYQNLVNDYSHLNIMSSLVLRTFLFQI